MMKSKLAPLLVAIASGFLLVGCCTTKQCCSQPSAPDAQWEYKVFKGYVYDSAALEQELKKNGSDGWTIVSSSTTQQANSVPEIIIIFKKHK